jgi:hypothetical protein
LARRSIGGQIVNTTAANDNTTGAIRSTRSRTIEVVHAIDVAKLVFAVLVDCGCAWSVWAGGASTSLNPARAAACWTSPTVASLRFVP